ncbi:hypothetical protein ACOBWA_06845 [Psychrobacter sp. ER1]|uniref:hypothetical protein n=1 Tax=Psychrobacter sp. ER1 TaxID=3406645 RepID=UPI003B42C883
MAQTLGSALTHRVEPATAKVIEIASFKLKPSISYDDFAVLDHSVEVNHVAKQKALYLVSQQWVKTANGWLWCIGKR